MPSKKDTLKAVWSRYRQEYLNLVTDLEQMVVVVPSDITDLRLKIADDPAVLNLAKQAIHTLKGALGSFGFRELSGASAQAERLISTAAQLTGEQIWQLSELIAQLRSTLEAASDPASATLALKDLTRQSSKSCDWLIVSCDMELTEDVIHQSSVWRLDTRVATTASEAWAVLSQHSPDVIVLDLDCILDCVDEPCGLDFLHELMLQHPTVSTIVMSAHDSLSDRIQAIRAGACTFLAKPVTSVQVVETVTNRLAQRTQPTARIVALDDDPAILLGLKRLLTPLGFQLTLVSDPLQLWEAIEKTVPDLLILDIEIPEFSGIELCKVIRSDPKLAQLPILFLSAHSDAEMVSQVFECGADDYVSKPIVGPALVTRILNRMERRRLLQKLAETDDLTGLSRRRQAVEVLERSLKLASRQKTTVCLAILDLDDFKQINDHYGHEIGDKVLKTLGDYLRQTFRGEDIVARWGGEEFMVGLYGTPKNIAVERLERFLRAFFQHIFQGVLQGNNQQRFQVSFSGGVAVYPTDGTSVQQLYRCADQALYQAKAAGRSRILPAESTQSSCLEG
ncbi:MAG: Response regulator containing a CheY-like receiver domain and a GGDEF domain [Phormidesmis priestleyi Ana]|uniref:Response regulator containing a CheY-like receiver domain and a GGDEF domain n=1 Tax=Phormidesmis priestleyi Ana TaxID=1666911 RepID=A0A0N8KNE0_9CYAN|nr:MAG: Response regulator containing a CheY-like receiver domain and a GGDEF domain [Phormidesmis priestleyi Ana]